MSDAVKYLCEYFDQLWPEAGHSDTERRLIRDTFRDVPEDQGRAALDAIKLERASRTVPVSVVAQSMRGIRSQNAAVKSGGTARVLESAGPLRDMAERCERYAAGGFSLWLADGFEERWWPHMQSVIAEWIEGKPVSVGTLIRRVMAGVEAKYATKPEHRSGAATLEAFWKCRDADRNKEAAR